MSCFADVIFKVPYEVTKRLHRLQRITNVIYLLDVVFICAVQCLNYGS